MMTMRHIWLNRPGLPAAGTPSPNTKSGPPCARHHDLTCHLVADSTLLEAISNPDLLPYAHELESVDSPGPYAVHKLASILSSHVLSATPTTEIQEIAHVMLDEQIRRF